MKPRYRRIIMTMFAVTIFALAAIVSLAQEKADFAKKTAALERYVKAQMQLDRIPGLSIAIYYGDFKWARGFGFSDIENRVPASEKTMYRWASVGKPITAAGVVKLATDGKLNLDDDVRKYVPYFPEKKWPVRIRHLLGHIGGISHYRNYDEEGHFKTHYTTEQSIGVFKDWELVAEPGTRYQYSSYGYNLLGAVIEGASGMSYSDYLTQNVWKPMGMHTIRMDEPNAIIPHRTRGYRVSNGEVINSEFVDISSRFGAGGIRATTLDIVAFARGLDEGKVLSHEQQAQMYDSMHLANGSETSYGMGWGTSSQQARFAVGHSGGQAETSTYLIRVPRQNFAVAVACNLEGSPAGNYARVAAGIFLDAHNIGVEVTNNNDRAILPLFIEMWKLGLPYFERHGSALSEDPQTLAAAFTLINTMADPEFASLGESAIREWFQEAEKPEKGHLITAAFSYITSRLHAAHGAERIAHYQSWEPFDFFADYIELCKNDSTIPGDFRLSPKLEKRITDWQGQWRTVWTDEMRSFFALPDSEFGSIVPRLQEITIGATVYPRFNNRINMHAYRLKASGKTREGLALLEIAADLYPSDANLLDSIGEFYLELGNKEKAVEFYRAAVAKNPRSLNSRYILAKIGPTEVAVDTLARYAGTYRLSQQLEFEIELDGAQLIAAVPGQGRLLLYPENADTFLVRDNDGDVAVARFTLKNGTVQGIEISYPNGSTLPAQKIR